MKPASLDPAWYADKLRVSGVPEHMWDGYLGYIVNGHPPGDFLRAVLSNDLAGVLRYADERNREAILKHVTFVVFYVPAAAHGSPERVAAWLESFDHEESA